MRPFPVRKMLDTMDPVAIRSFVPVVMVIILIHRSGSAMKGR